MQKQQVMNSVLTIQQIAQATGLSAHTLRYYERAGLMQEVGRDESSGYRAYTWEHINWIEFIKRLRATGMPIRDIRSYTRLILEGEQTIADRLSLLKQHRRRVEEHLQEIEQHLVAIAEKIALYEQQPGQPSSRICSEPSR